MEKWYVKDWHTRIEIKCEGNVIANLDSSGFTLLKDEANANRIVKVINCHDDLVEALKVALDFFVQYDLQQKVISGISLQLNEALAKVE